MNSGTNTVAAAGEFAYQSNQSGQAPNGTFNSEDWRNIQDVVSRRRKQNRDAQRKYRENIKRRLDQATSVLLPLSPAATQLDTIDQFMSTPVSENGDMAYINNPTPSNGRMSISSASTYSSSQTSISKAAMMCESFPTAEARTRGALQSSVQPQQPQQRSSTAQNDHRPAIASHSCPTPTPMPTNFLEIDSSTDQKLFGNAPLHRATRGGHIGIVQLLTEQGAYLEAVNDCGQTALHIAAECGHASIVRLLLEKGLYVNLRDLSGLTALHLAAAEGHEEVVMLLLGAGVDID